MLKKITQLQIYTHIKKTNEQRNASITLDIMSFCNNTYYLVNLLFDVCFLYRVLTQLS